MSEIYFIYDDKIMKGIIIDKKSDGAIVTSGNEVLWLPITEPRFSTEQEAIEYKFGCCFTPQEENSNEQSLEKLARIKGHFNPKDIANKELFEEDFDTIEKELRAFDIIRKYVWKAYKNNDVDNDLRDINKQLEAVKIIKKYRHFDVYNGDLVVHVPDGDEENKEYELLEEVFSDE